MTKSSKTGKSKNAATTKIKKPAPSTTGLPERLASAAEVFLTEVAKIQDVAQSNLDDLAKAMRKTGKLPAADKTRIITESIHTLHRSGGFAEAIMGTLDQNINPFAPIFMINGKKKSSKK